MEEFHTYNIDSNKEIFFLWDIQANTRRRIGDRKDLLVYVARELTLNSSMRIFPWENSKIWTEKDIHDTLYHDGNKYRTNNIFSGQNLTLNDIYYTTEEKRILSPVQEDPDHMTYDYKFIKVSHRKPYVFYTNDGTIFDIRQIADDVIKYLMLGGDIHCKSSWNEKSYRFRRHKHHHAYSHPRYFHKRELVVKGICKELDVHYRTKARLDENDYYNFSRRSSNWKDKKDKFQWEHNLRNKKTYNKPPVRTLYMNVALNEELEELSQSLSSYSI